MQFDSGLRLCDRRVELSGHDEHNGENPPAEGCYGIALNGEPRFRNRDVCATHLHEQSC